MHFSLFSRQDWEEAGERARKAHSEWLTKALRSGSKVPRIPLRRVSDGGWDSMMATEEGRCWATEFWQSAIGHD